MVDEAVVAMTHQLTRVGNASSLHGSGRAARRVVEESREAIAARVGARPAEVIFTSGGTEADNLAVKGGFWTQAGHGRDGLVTSSIEHPAVHDSASWLAHHAAAKLDLVSVDRTGLVDLDQLDQLIGATTALVSVMWANNEVGSVQPVARIAELARSRGALVHSDAVQAVAHLPVDFAASGLDLLSFTAHKLGGPCGVGALLARREVRLTSVQHGGGQERDVRSGTLDVAAIAGFAAAVELAYERQQQEAERLRVLRERLIDGVRAVIPDMVRHGAAADPGAGLPGVANLGLPGAPADAVIMLLDAAGIDISAGSACSAGVAQPSHVLLAMGYDEAEARSSVRFSLGHTTTEADVERALAALPDAVGRARAAARFA